MLNIFNEIWKDGKIPESWLTSTIIPIHKSGKPPGNPQNYRPIALTSCIGKVFERIINTRLVWHLEQNNLIHKNQYGFRKNRSTIDPLNTITSTIMKGFSRGETTSAIFFDIEKAYDTVDRQSTIDQLLAIHIKGKMLKYIHSFLTKRDIQVKINNTMSNKIPKSGIPQGSILSVTLFLFTINSVLENLPAMVQGTLYADDLVIYTISRREQAAARRLQRAVNNISKWADERNLKFSENKTVRMTFKKRFRNTDTETTIMLKNKAIRTTSKTTYLGLIMDKHLNWSDHIKNLKTKAKQALNIFKVVAGYKWGADRRTLQRLYWATCRSQIDYGCQIYGSASESQLGKLDSIQNEAMRICSGAFRSSPIESLSVETYQPPLDLRRTELGLRYLFKKQANSSNQWDMMEEHNDTERVRNQNRNIPCEV